MQGTNLGAWRLEHDTIPERQEPNAATVAVAFGLACVKFQNMELEKLNVVVQYGGQWKFKDFRWKWASDYLYSDFLVDRTILFEQLRDKICQITGIDRHANDIMIYSRPEDEPVLICSESHWAAIKSDLQECSGIVLYMTCTPRKPEKPSIGTKRMKLEKLGVCVRYGGEWKFTDFNWVWVGDLACTNVLLVDRTILFEQLLDKICQTTRIDQCANDIMIYRRCEDESVPICNESHWAAIKYVFQKCHEIDLYMTCTPRRPEKLSIRTKGMELKKLGVCVRYGGEWKFTDFNWVWVGDLACTNFLLVYRTILLEQLLDKICQTTAIDRYANDIMIYRRCDLETVPICNESHWATMKYVYQKRHVIDLCVTCTPRKSEKLSIRTEGMELEKLGVCVRYGGEWKFTGFNWVWIGDLACTNFLLVDRKILFEQLLDKICQTTGIDRYSNDIMIYRKYYDDPVPLCNESHWAAIKYVYQKRHDIELCMTCNPRRPEKLSIQTKGMELEKLGVCVRYGGDWKFTDSEWVWVGDLACTNFLLADRTILFEQLLDTICQSTGIDRYANDIMIYRICNFQRVTICNESDWAAIKHVYQKIDEIDLYMTCIPRRPEKLSIRTKGRQVEARANF